MRFSAQLKDGELFVDDKKKLAQWLKGQKAGSYVLQIKSKATEKSGEANRYFWVLIGCIATYTGYDKMQVYDMACALHMRFENEKGVVEFLTWSQLDSKQAHTVTERVQQWMATEIEMEVPQRGA